MVEVLLETSNGLMILKLGTPMLDLPQGAILIFILRLENQQPLSIALVRPICREFFQLFLNIPI
jgi:hypothetical protein